MHDMKDHILHFQPLVLHSLHSNQCFTRSNELGGLILFYRLAGNRDTLSWQKTVSTRSFFISSFILLQTYNRTRHLSFLQDS